MVDITRKQKIAAGHDNFEELLPFHLLDECYLKKYDKMLLTQWNRSESIEIDGDNRQVLIGKPWERIVFPIIELDEAAFIIAEFCPNGLDDEVTWFTFDRHFFEWRYYNATLRYPSAQGGYSDNGGELFDFTLDFIELTEITP